MEIADILEYEALFGGSSGGGGGETWTETLLWENPSPTADFAFTTFTEWPNDIPNYDYIKIVFKSAKAKSDEYVSISDVQSTLKQLNGKNGYATITILSVYFSDGTTQKKRVVNISASNNGYALQIGQCVDINSASPYQNSWLIPLAIYGIKKG